MTRRPHHALRVLVATLVLAGLWLGGLHLGGLETGLLFLAPAFALMLPLLAGRYPGERVLVPRGAAVRHRLTGTIHFPRPRVRLVPRGGLLVGCSLAGRAPPA